MDSKAGTIIFSGPVKAVIETGKLKKDK
jgi:hypothetical protein